MNKKTLLTIISILVTLLILISFIKPKKITNTTEPTQEQSSPKANQEKEPKSKGPVSIEMISPEEETFVAGQARFWKGQIENKPENTRTYCNWKFYMSPTNDNEYLYEEKTSRTAGDWCGFTSTFIEEKGKLRVELDLIVKDEDTEEITVLDSTERTFLVN